MPKALQKLHNGQIITLWKGNPTDRSKEIKTNLNAQVYSADLFGELTTKGYDVQSPAYVYQYPGHYTKPRDCQREMLAFQLRHKRWYNLSEPRTGKSAPVAWEIDIDAKYNNKTKFLILAPLSTLLDTWRTELFGICTHIPAFYATQGGTEHLRKALKKALKRQGPQIFVVNFDKFWRVLPEIIEWGPQKLYIDEASDFNNPDARRSRNLVALLKKYPDIELGALTGTPFPNRPTDAWSIARLINPATPKHLGTFRSMTMTQHPFSKYKWTPKPEAKQILAELMQPSIRFKTDDVNDMPDHEGFIVRTHMAKKQDQMFREMKSEMVTEDKGRIITALSAGTKLWKLLQIASGVCYDEDSVPLLIGAKPKIEEVKRLIRETPKQTVIMSNFTAVQKYIIENLRGEYRVGAY